MSRAVTGSTCRTEGLGSLFFLQFLCSLLPRGQQGCPGDAITLASTDSSGCSGCDMEENGREPLVSGDEDAPGTGMAFLECLEGMAGYIEVMCFIAGSRTEFPVLQTEYRTGPDHSVASPILPRCLDPHLWGWLPLTPNPTRNVPPPPPPEKHLVPCPWTRFKP